MKYKNRLIDCIFKIVLAKRVKIFIVSNLFILWLNRELNIMGNRTDQLKKQKKIKSFSRNGQ